jgi:hypothetical protein
VITPGPDSWDAGETSLPQVLKTSTGYEMWYSGEPGIDIWTSKIGYAVSSDGTTWIKKGVDLDLGSVGMPDSYRLAGQFVLRNSDGSSDMYYSGADTVTNRLRIQLATSGGSFFEDFNRYSSINDLSFQSIWTMWKPSDWYGSVSTSLELAGIGDRVLRCDITNTPSTATCVDFEARDATASDLSLEFDLKDFNRDPSGPTLVMYAGIDFRADDQNCYRFAILYGQAWDSIREILFMVPDRHSWPQHPTMLGSTSWRTASFPQTHHYRIECMGSGISAFMDSATAPIITATDTSLTSGYIGTYFESGNGDGGAIHAWASFDNIQLISGTSGDPGDTSSLAIGSGTGTFSELSSSNKQITVDAGASISGTVTMTAVSMWASSAVITLAGSPSWGTHSSSYSEVAGLSTPATTTLAATVDLTAPSTSGTYCIVFLFSGEYNGAEVASLTNWAYGSPVWDDGNDIADFSSTQITEAQSNGRTTVQYLMEGGYQWINRPADVVTVVVQSQQPIENLAPEEIREWIVAVWPYAWQTEYTISFADGILLIELDIQLIGDDPGDALRQQWHDGIEGIWSNAYDITDGTLRYPIEVSVDWVTANANYVVRVHNELGRTDMANWYMQSGWGPEYQDEIAAHEAGHMLGLYDEYAEPFTDTNGNGRYDAGEPFTDTYLPLNNEWDHGALDPNTWFITTGTIMSNLGSPMEWNYEDIVDWLETRSGRDLSLAQSPLPPYIADDPVVGFVDPPPTGVTYDDLREVVIDCCFDGNFNPGQANSLLQKLDASQHQWQDKDNTKAATNIMEAFINEIGALVSAGVLGESQGSSLINSANVLIVAIQPP